MDGGTKTTVILIGVFGFCSAPIMILRLALRRIRQQDLNLGDYLTLAAIACVASRTGFAMVIVVWGNNNLPPSPQVFTATEIYQRVIGSRLTLVNRVVYNTYIWIQKSIVLLLYWQLLNELPSTHHIMNVYWIILAMTYVVVQAVTFIECHPFHLYWQVVPNPGNCTHARIQLSVFVALNIFTDILLIILPIPWLLRMQRSLKQRLLLVGLFSIGVLLVAIAIIRFPIYNRDTVQLNRNTWGSVEEFAAALVANVPVLYSLRRRRQAMSDEISPWPSHPLLLPRYRSR
ncbi:hypothetical protein OIDMADRAFT_36628 [Oidiodendron maius Zn]|uniref:Rhodopsin domain-containing protein n=1 Tax=Oidiodendron maius (strain Zn) TaxID=913774 RepID=A0A0C3HF61_OIDMZ|nr:hypothetical protein OIDMADRAFT_36628 [Oidiodendron maius Zn]